MTFLEIIQKLRDKDQRVTQCFFYWDGPSIQRIESVRRTDPIAAARMRRPVCASCRPALLSVLHKLYGSDHFDYDEMVSDFYYYLMTGDKLADIKEPEALMGWIVTSAYFFFLHKKRGAEKLLENKSQTPLDNEMVLIEDESRAQARLMVAEVLAAMPNRIYARLLDEVVLEVGQYQGRKKSALLKQKAEELGIPIDNLYVKISLAKKQFKQTALKLNMKA